MATGLVRAAYYLRQIQDTRIHSLLGFRTIAEYARAAAGFTPAQTREFLVLARKLPDFPVVSHALDSGELSWTKAREICRLTSPEDQEKWIDLARTLPRRSLRAAIGEAQQRETRRSQPSGATPEAPATTSATPHPPRQPRPASRTPAPPPAPSRHHATLAFDGEQMARWLAVTATPRVAGRREDAVLEGLDALTSGRRDTGGAAPAPPYLVVVLTCPDCGRSSIATGRGEAPATAPLLAAARCDATVEAADGRRRRTVPPR